MGRFKKGEELASEALNLDFQLLQIKWEKSLIPLLREKGGKKGEKEKEQNK